jgi:hypothetical protein
MLNEATDFHIPKKIQCIVSRIPRTEGRPTRYRTLSIAFMEFHETFTSRAMRRPNI